MAHKVLLDLGHIIYLYIVISCFYETQANLSGCDKDLMAYTP